MTFGLDFSKLPNYLQEKLGSRKTREHSLDYELYEDLEPYLGSLIEHGLISGSNNPFRRTEVRLVDGCPTPIFSLVYQVDVARFRLAYSVDPEQQIVKIENFEIKTLVDMDVVKQSLENQVLQQEFTGDLPQADRPTSIIKAVELVSVDYKTSLSIGKALGHKAIKPKDVERHGCYKLTAAINLGLVERYKEGRKTFYKLTEKGQRIAALGTNCDGSGNRYIDSHNKDISTQYRLMVEVMLSYYPMRLIFDEILQQGKGLTVERIQQYIDEEIKPGYHSQKTSYRRARCLMTWTFWLAMVSGIPVVRQDTEDKQLVLNLF